jgi:prolyl-tRNA synthetase
MFAKLGRKTSYQGRRWILQLMYEAGLIQPVKKGGHFWQPMFPDLDSYFKVIRRELNFELGGMDINLVVQDANGENVI